MNCHFISRASTGHKTAKQSKFRPKGLAKLRNLLLGLAALFAVCNPGMANAAGLIINEASQGTSGAKEFYEFMVVGHAGSPTGAVNLNG